MVNGVDERVDAVVAEIRQAGGIASPLRGSVCDDAQTIVNEAVEAAGRLDIVINNAGIGVGGIFTDVEIADFQRAMNVHLGGTVRITLAAWPHLCASGNGRVLNTTSGSVFGTAFAYPYVAAKGAIFALTRAWAMEAKALEAPIRVMAVMPAALTAMSENIVNAVALVSGLSDPSAMMPNEAMRDLMKTYFDPDQVAGCVAWLVHRDTKIHGETLSIGGGRAARVLLAQPAGISTGSANPDAWIGCEDNLLSQSELRTPETMMKELGWQAENIGPDVFAAFQRIGNG
jgi:NAD(P)-dependent dehydrogenase (short-subunit alcohol dehydrogenase family)